MGARQALPTKTCLRCGRSFTWRRKWARDWENVRYCSNACRRSAGTTIEREREEGILTALARAGREGIELSALARKNEEIESFRQAARRLAMQGRISILQKGRPVDSDTMRGPVTIVPLESS